MISGNGLYWVIKQKNTNYDGMPYFLVHNGEVAVVRNWNGKLRRNHLGSWRESYIACVGTEGGQHMVIDMTRKMTELKPNIVQQFDQGPGLIACYAHDHGYPPVPGPWMTAAFDRLLTVDTQAARSTDATVAMSCEGAPRKSIFNIFRSGMPGFGPVLSIPFFIMDMLMTLRVFILIASAMRRFAFPLNVPS